MKNWFFTTSELFVDLAAAVIVLAVIETQIFLNSKQNLLLLTFRIMVAILFIALSKHMRDQAERL